MFVKIYFLTFTDDRFFCSFLQDCILIYDRVIFECISLGTIFWTWDSRVHRHSLEGALEAQSIISQTFKLRTVKDWRRGNEAKHSESACAHDILRTLFALLCCVGTTLVLS